MLPKRGIEVRSPHMNFSGYNTTATKWCPNLGTGGACRCHQPPVPLDRLEAPALVHASTGRVPCASVHACYAMQLHAKVNIQIHAWHPNIACINTVLLNQHMRMQLMPPPSHSHSAVFEKLPLLLCVMQYRSLKPY